MTVVGFIGTAGAIGGMLMASATGHLLEITGSYKSLFVVAASMYSIAFIVIHLLVPNIDSVKSLNLNYLNYDIHQKRY
jgi:MFS transporter, ACS family, hexuronate transporter